METLLPKLGIGFARGVRVSYPSSCERPCINIGNKSMSMNSLRLNLCSLLERISQWAPSKNWQVPLPCASKALEGVAEDVVDCVRSLTDCSWHQ
jgi:hypothetical protein